VARRLSQGRAQFLRRTVARGREFRVAPQPLHEPGGCAPAGFEVAREVHAAHHALAREFGRARLQLRAAFRQHVGQ
jgi:hypothetical protein